MRYFEKITRYNVEELDEQLTAQPELWDTYTIRTASPHLPFHGTGDIWIRHRAKAEIDADLRKLGEPHFAEWWPAWHKLPALKPLVFDLMRRECATALGAIFITRIPPGGMVKPHHDRGGWHAEFFPRKIYVTIRTNDRVVNRVEDEAVIMKRGDAWWFNNLPIHSVENGGDTERWTLIVCMRRE